MSELSDVPSAGTLIGEGELNMPRADRFGGPGVGRLPRRCSMAPRWRAPGGAPAGRPRPDGVRALRTS